MGGPVPHSKNIPLNPSGKSKLKSAASHPSEGRFAIVTDAGWDAVDAAASGAKRVRRAASRRERTTARKMNDTSCVRQNRVVPTPVAGAKLRGGCVNSTELDQPPIRQRRRQDEFVSGERGISRKAIAQGMPECSVCTCMLVCVSSAHYCTRDRGCSVHPAFPAPSSFAGQGSCKASGAFSRGFAEPCPAVARPRCLR